MKFEKSTLEKPEVMEIANALNLDVDAVIGKLLRVWNWFDDHTTDGNAPVTVRSLLDRYTGVAGFVTAMEEVGWMVELNGRLILPNFDRHNGATSKKRALATIRQAKHRIGNAESNAENNAHSVTKTLPEKRREEKRREELIESSKDDSCPPASDDGEVLALIWSKTPGKGRERSSKKLLETEWRKLPKKNRPTISEITDALDAWAKSEKWLQGYAEGIHLWVKNRQWQNIPEPMQAQSTASRPMSFGTRQGATHYLYKDEERAEIPDL